jgi:FAD-linked sulfhydryl oxidase
MAASYPAKATPVQQNDMSSFLRTFSLFYPCWVCAEDFRTWMAKKENEPVLNQGWKGLGQWMCRAHNEVNVKLGKDEFDCNLWQERWKDGFKDGRCDP